MGTMERRMRMEDSTTRWTTNKNSLDHVRAFKAQLSHAVHRGNPLASLVFVKNIINVLLSYLLDLRRRNQRISVDTTIL